jgi:hypothetical protein
MARVFASQITARQDSNWLQSSSSAATEPRVLNIPSPGQNHTIVFDGNFMAALCSKAELVEHGNVTYVCN